MAKILVVLVVLAVLALLWWAYSTSGTRMKLTYRGKLPPTGSVVGRVTGLYTYPLKSGKALSLPVAELDGRGLRGDRTLVVLDSSNHRRSQFHIAKMATVLALPDPEHKTVTLSAEGFDPITVPLENPQGRKTNVDIILTGIDTQDLGDEVGAWISRVLDKPGLRIARVLDNAYRKMSDYPLWFKSSLDEDKTGAQSYGPILVTNEGSLTSLNTKIEAEERVPMNRFRANIVVSGFEPWMEDQWKTIRVGDVVLSYMAPCLRCLLPTVNQDTGEAGYVTKGPRKAQPTKALREYRAGSLKRSFLGLAPTEMGGAGGFAPAFGVLFAFATHPKHAATVPVADQDYGRLKVGDEVVILEYHKPKWHHRLFGM